jgi:hypothetical protein
MARDVGVLSRRGQIARAARRRENDRDLVEPRTVVDRSGDIVAAVGQQIERAAIACAVARPGFRVDRHAGAGAKSLAEPVAQIGLEAADADQSLVDEREATERDGVFSVGGTSRDGRNRKRHKDRAARHDPGVADREEG